MEPLRGRVQKVQKVLPASSGRVQRVWNRLTAMSIKSALRECLSHISHSNLGGESAAYGGFSPFGACGTTFPPQKRGNNNPCYTLSHL